MEQHDAGSLADVATSAALDQVHGVADTDLAPTPQNADPPGHRDARRTGGRRPAVALARLRARAFAKNRPLYGLAVDVVTGGRTSA